MMNAYDLAVVLTVTDRASKAIANVDKGLGGLAQTGKRMSDWGAGVNAQGQLMLATAQRIGAGLMSIVAPANTLDDALAKVATVITPLDTMASSMANVRQASLDWSMAHRESAAQFADTTYMMISAGLAEQAAIEGTRVAMQVATATMGESTEAASLVATLYNNVGDKSADLRSEMARLGNVVTKTQQTFQFANLGQLSEGMKYATPVALQYRMGLEEVSTIIGQLNNKGIVGSQAGTSFAATMRSMQKASKDLNFEIARTDTGAFDFINTLKNIERTYGSLESMSPEVLESFQTAFGSEGWMGLSLMIGKSAELEENLRKVSDNADAAAKAAATIEAAGSGPMQIFNNNLQAVKITLAEELNPVIAEALPVITNFVKEVGSFAKAHPSLTKTALLFFLVMAATLAIVAPIMMAVGALGMFAGHAVTVFARVGQAIMWMGRVAIPWLFRMTLATLRFFVVLALNPITWIVLAIIAAVVLIYTYWEPISGFFSRLWQGIKDGFVFAWQATLAFFWRIMGEIRAAFDQGWTFGIVKVLLAFSPVYWISRAFGAVTQWLFGFSLHDAGANIVRSITDGIVSMANAPVERMRAIVQRIRNLLPFSPAKDGPLRDIHRIKLVETIAGSVRPEPLTNAMRRTVGLAAATVPLAFGSPAIPSFVPLPAPGEVSRAGGAGGMTLHATFHIGGDATPDTVRMLDEWLRTHGREVAAVVAREQRLASRGEFA